MTTSLPRRSPNQLLPCRSICRATSAWTWVTLGKWPTRKVSFALVGEPVRTTPSATAIAAKVRAQGKGAPSCADCLVIVATLSLFELRTVVFVDRISDAVVDGFRCYKTGTASIYGRFFKCICGNMCASGTPPDQLTFHTNALAGGWLRSILLRARLRGRGVTCACPIPARRHGAGDAGTGVRPAVAAPRAML